MLTLKGFLHLLPILVLLSSAEARCGRPFKEVLEWTQLEFDYDPALQEEDIESGYFERGYVAPLDVAVHYKNKVRRIFLTIPRSLSGAPVTLGLVSTKSKGVNRMIKPYPSMAWHRDPVLCKSRRLVSVFRVSMDKCNRLWVLDSGQYNGELACPPQILAFDLSNDKVVCQYEMPENLYEQGSYFVTPIVDVREDCDDAHVYAADSQENSLIVYSYRKDRAWKVVDRTMYPDPIYGYRHYQGEYLHLMDGILGMDLEPYVGGQDRKLFYHSLSAATENWVYTSHLQDESRFAENPESSPEVFHTLRASRLDTSAAQAVDSQGVAYFASLSSSALLCWNTRSKEYGSYIDTVYQDNRTMNFPSGLKVVQHPHREEELWVFTTRYHKALLGTIDPTKVNFRISKVSTASILRSTSCGQPDKVGLNCGRETRMKKWSTFSARMQMLLQKILKASLEI